MERLSRMWIGDEWQKESHSRSFLKQSFLHISAHTAWKRGSVCTIGGGLTIVRRRRTTSGSGSRRGG